MTTSTKTSKATRFRKEDGAILTFKAVNRSSFYRSDVYETEDKTYSIVIRTSQDILGMFVVGFIAFGLVTFIFISDRWFMTIGHIIFLLLLWTALVWSVLSDALVLWRHPILEEDANSD